MTSMNAAMSIACGQAIEQVLQPMQYQMSEDCRASRTRPSWSSRMTPFGR